MVDRPSETVTTLFPPTSHGTDDWDIAELVAVLVDRSLLVVHRREGRSWFRLLESLREYASERLDTTRDSDRVRARHAETYVSLAEQTAAKLRQTDESRERWFRFVHEYDNLAHAADWARSTGNSDLLERLEPAAAQARFTVSIQGMGRTARYLDHDQPDTAEKQQTRLRVQDEAFNSLIELCHELTQSEWDLPTDCDRWSVKDVISHICGMIAAFTGDHVAPVELPPDFDPGSGDPMYALHVALSEMHIIARRPLPPAAVLSDLERLVHTRLRHEAEGLVFDMPGPAIDEAVDVVAFDTWVHEQDIRRATNRPGNLDSPTAQRAVDRGIAVIAYIIAKRVGAPEGTTAQIDITDPIPRSITISVNNGRGVETDPVSEPTAHLAMDAETFCCLGAGRWTSADALQHGATINGDQQLGTAIFNSMTYVP